MRLRILLLIKQNGATKSRTICGAASNISPDAIGGELPSLHVRNWIGCQGKADVKGNKLFVLWCKCSKGRQ